MIDKIIVGIDFSINSPAICIKESNKYKYFGFLRKNYKTSKANKIIINEFNNTKEDITTIWLEDHDTSDVYYKRELLNLKDAVYVIDVLVNTIKQNIDQKKEIYIGIEGLSFGSKANRLAEISGYQFLLRSEIYKLLQEFYVFSPMSVKLTAGKGNYKKDEIFNSFLINNTEANQVETFRSLNKKSGLLHPFEDMIDAYWVLKTVEKKILNIS